MTKNWKCYSKRKYKRTLKFYCNTPNNEYLWHSELMFFAKLCFFVLAIIRFLRYFININVANLFFYYLNDKDWETVINSITKKSLKCSFIENVFFEKWRFCITICYLTILGCQESQKKFLKFFLIYFTFHLQL